MRLNKMIPLRTRFQKGMALSWALVLGLGSNAARAMPATVAGVQTPAWVERAGARTPLQPGEILSSSDVLETGKDGRVHVALPDGSTLKLGQEARIALEQLIPPETPGGLFRGTLNVLRGAFRYTTSKLARVNQRREVNIQIASITVAIRGTDIWGRSNTEADLVCLIEGHIRVDHAGTGAVPMNTPLSFFVVPKNAAPKDIAPVDPKKLQTWAVETEFAPARGVLTPEGGWGVQLGVFNDEPSARRLQQDLESAGYPAILTAMPGKARYRVSVVGFNTLIEARVFAQEMRGRFGIRGAQVECLASNTGCSDRL